MAAYKGITPNYTAALANNGWDPETRAFPAQVGEVLDIIWESNSGPTSGYDFHPMHAHGEHYWDLGSGPGVYNATANNAKFANYTPAKRDTTQLYRYNISSQQPYVTNGWRAWRIRVTEDNVGAWMMHCHVLGHMTMGESCLLRHLFSAFTNVNFANMIDVNRNDHGLGVWTCG